jgi:hypothetical protein
MRFRCSDKPAKAEEAPPTPETEIHPFYETQPAPAAR